MSEKIIVYGYGDKTKKGLADRDVLIEYLSNELFTSNECRHRYSQTKNADIIVMSQDGFAHGHLIIKDMVKPTPEDIKSYRKTKKVYIVSSSAAYENPVRLIDLEIRVHSFGKFISKKEFVKIKNRAGKIKCYSPKEVKRQ